MVYICEKWYGGGGEKEAHVGNTLCALLSAMPSAAAAYMYRRVGYCDFSVCVIMEISDMESLG